MRFAMIALCVSFGGLPAENALAQTMLTPAAEIALKLVVQNYLKGPLGEEYQPARFYPVFANLADGGRAQILIYVTGPHWCGTGGCNLLVANSTDGSYQVVSKTIGVQLPVRILFSKTAGWHDLGVESAEGSKLLSFNGRRYPINAYSFPSRHLSGEVAGTIVIPTTAEGVPLYN